MMVLVHVSFYCYLLFILTIFSRVVTLCCESRQKRNIATDLIKQWWTNLLSTKCGSFWAKSWRKEQEKTPVFLERQVSVTRLLPRLKESLRRRWNPRLWSFNTSHFWKRKQKVLVADCRQSMRIDSFTKSSRTTCVLLMLPKRRRLWKIKIGIRKRR